MKSGISPLAVALLILPALNAAADTHYVDLNSLSPTPPYTNWPTAATNIQDAILVAAPGDRVLVTNGIYATGGFYSAGSNRVSIFKPLTVESVNGPTETIIKGYQVPATTNGLEAIRCVYLVADAMLSGFTLTNGATLAAGNSEASGGGAFCTSTNSLLTNCIIVGNSARWGGGLYSGTADASMLLSNTALNGGGAYQSSLRNSVVLGNTAAGPIAGSGRGGGLYYSPAYNCLVVRNKADQGGGAYGVLMGRPLNNCTIVANSAEVGGGFLAGALPASARLANNSVIFFNSAVSNYNHENSSGVYLDNCCTYPLPVSGSNNITNEPLLLDTNNWADLRLQSNSPCINAGNNAYVSGSTDLDDNPRIVGGTVDMGAYEFQSPSSVLSYAWAQQYGLPTDGSADFVDTDGEGANNWREWRAGTVPTNAASALRMAGISNAPTGLAVTWNSVTNRSYWLERADDLGAAPAFQTIATNLPGVAGPKTFTDITATNEGPYFYRVGVE